MLRFFVSFQSHIDLTRNNVTLCTILHTDSNLQYFPHLDQYFELHTVA
jgi:hypothetical protein